MSERKKHAIEVIDRLHSENRIEYPDYCTIYDGLDDIDTRREGDEELEELWTLFSDIPMDPETERIEEDFLGFAEGTHREDILHWFDERHSNGAAYLMYNGIETYVPETRRLYGLKNMCEKCGDCTCAYNHEGECRFALVHEMKPDITENDGCRDCCCQKIRLIRISIDMIMRGIQTGVVQFITDPNMGYGTVCKIGDYWFYFGGITAEEMEPDEYVKKFSVEKIAGIVFRVFEEWRASGFFTDEYRYCFAVLARSEFRD